MRTYLCGVSGRQHGQVSRQGTALQGGKVPGHGEREEATKPLCVLHLTKQNILLQCHVLDPGLLGYIGNAPKNRYISQKPPCMPPEPLDQAPLAPVQLTKERQEQGGLS